MVDCSSGSLGVLVLGDSLRPRPNPRGPNFRFYSLGVLVETHRVFYPKTVQAAKLLIGRTRQGRKLPRLRVERQLRVARTLPCVDQFRHRSHVAGVPRPRRSFARVYGYGLLLRLSWTRGSPRTVALVSSSPHSPLSFRDPPMEFSPSPVPGPPFSVIDALHVTLELPRTPNGNEPEPTRQIGSGLGYWAMLLRSRGVDVKAYDKVAGAPAPSSEGQASASSKKRDRNGPKKGGEKAPKKKRPAHAESEEDEDDEEPPSFWTEARTREDPR